MYFCNCFIFVGFVKIFFQFVFSFFAWQLVLLEWTCDSVWYCVDNHESNVQHWMFHVFPLIFHMQASTSVFFKNNFLPFVSSCPPLSRTFFLYIDIPLFYWMFPTVSSCIFGWHFVLKLSVNVASVSVKCLLPFPFIDCTDWMLCNSCK